MQRGITKQSMEITDEMISDKIKQLDDFDKKYGKCTRSIAMRKYCTDPIYRQRVKQFNKTSAQLIIKNNIGV